MPENSHDAEVLIVDDDARRSSVLSDVLELEGYSVASSPNGTEGLDYLRGSPQPRLIILDLEMPMIDSWEFRREQLKVLPQIPVIVLTAHSGFIDVRADAVMRKPVDLDQLLILLRHLLRGADS